MAKQTFTAGQVLTATQVNGLQTNDFNQTVSTKTAAYTFVVDDRGTRVVLNDTTARTFTIDNNIFSAGDTIYVHNINTGVLTIAAGAGVTLNGADVLTVAQWQSGTIYFTSASSAIFFPTAKTVSSAVAQVKSTAKTDTFTTTSTSLVDITGLSVSITPTSASNKVLVIVHLSMSAGGASDPPFAIVRDSTQIAQGDTAGSRNRRTSGASNSSNNGVQTTSMTFLDSPATTSATTYKIQTQQIIGQSTTCINRSVTDTDSTSYSRLISTITVMEVAP